MTGFFKSNIIPQAQLGYISKILPSQTALQNFPHALDFVQCKGWNNFVP